MAKMFFGFFYRESIKKIKYFNDLRLFEREIQV